MCWLLTTSILIFPIICCNVLISDISSICFVSVVSALVSAVYIIYKMLLLFLFAGVYFSEHCHLYGWSGCLLASCLTYACRAPLLVIPTPRYLQSFACSVNFFWVYNLQCSGSLLADISVCCWDPHFKHKPTNWNDITVFADYLHHLLSILHHLHNKMICISLLPTLYPRFPFISFKTRQFGELCKIVSTLLLLLFKVTISICGSLNNGTCSMTFSLYIQNII